MEEVRTQRRYLRGTTAALLVKKVPIRLARRLRAAREFDGRLQAEIVIEALENWVGNFERRFDATRRETS